MRRIFTSLLIGFALLSNAQAGEWAYVGNTPQYNAIVAYDRDSIKINQEEIQVWTAWINSIPKFDFDLNLALLGIDCTTGRYRTQRAIFYLQGKQLEDAAGDGQWKYATPGSLSKLLLGSVCSRSTPGPVYRGKDKKGLTKWGKQLLNDLKKKNGSKKP